MATWEDLTPEEKKFLSEIKINDLDDLILLLRSMPEGTTCNVLPEDLENGNFDVAVLQKPARPDPFIITYTGPVRKGYVGPFERAIQASC